MGGREGPLEVSDGVGDDVAFDDEDGVVGELGEVHKAVLLHVVVAALVHPRVVHPDLHTHKSGA